MTLYGYALGVLFLIALYLTWNLFAMNREGKRMLRQMRERERLSIARESEIAEALDTAIALREAAQKFYREASSRWSKLVLMERRVH